jgi:tetratricopeptide (TPR) repeat protein
MKLKPLVLALASLMLNQSAFANGTLDEAKTYVEKGLGLIKEHITPVAQPQHLSFQQLFPKPIYKKSYFGFALTGATVVLGGTYLFFTAGAGAPAAYAGTGAVATWVGGGSAGSYMSGLSTIGGWFGGNAILGGAILNGISIGVVGGGASKFATLTAIKKSLVLSSVAATALDGVALIENPQTKNLNYQVRLMLPQGIGSEEVQKFAETTQVIEEKLLAADSQNDKKSYELWAKKKQAHVDIGKKWVEDARKSNSVTGSDLIIYGVFSKNIGDASWYSSLISRVRVKDSANTGYLDYLRAVANIEIGNLEESKKLLYRSIDQNTYAIEPYLLLINLLGKDFKSNEKELLALTAKAAQSFDPDKYETGYSLVSIYYRMGTLCLQNSNYVTAENYFDSALEQVTLLQKYLGGKQVVNLIQIGKANALHGMNKIKEADILYQLVLRESNTAWQVDFIKGHYVGS